MKYFIVIPDGAADQPRPELGGKTPLEAATTPHMDSLAHRGRIGLTNHVPEQYSPGSEVACMSLMGYDPTVYFTGRAPLEAAAQHIDLAENDWAIRCNLVTISLQHGREVMEDFTADHITTEESQSLLSTAQQGLTDNFPDLVGWTFTPGVSYRNLLLYRGLNDRPSLLGTDLTTTPPHDLMDKPIEESFPQGTGGQLLKDIMLCSSRWLINHPINQQRQREGKRPATHVWLWGAGRAPSMESFIEKYTINGTMITAVDLLRGLASLAGWKRQEVPGATGYLDTDYMAKGRYAIKEFSNTDLVCVHVEAPDEASHEGNTTAKVRSLEQIDEKIVGPVWNHLRSLGDYRILICPDHPTFIATKTHSRGPVPFVMAGSDITSSGLTSYCEASAALSNDVIQEGWQLIGEFLRKG